MTNKKFTPLVFLASLGAGGISIVPFVLMQYTIHKGPGLITRAQLWANDFSPLVSGYYYALELIMIIFALLNIVLTIMFAKKLFTWMMSKDCKELVEDPLKNAAILVPLISILMTMNVFIGVVRYFLPIVSSNFQSLFLPALIFWSILFVIVIFTEIKLLGISFRKGFDMEKINFGWLLHPFVLGMLTVVGTGITAMSHNPAIADTAVFMSLISGSMGLFLLTVKMVVIFKGHFAAKGLPEKQFLPSFLIVIPNITLFSLSAYRLGHYLEHSNGFEMGAYSYLVVGLSFAFEIWYMLFGISLLVDYFKKHHFKDFYVTQWGFICPLVAFSVLGSFAYKIVAPNPALYFVLVLSMVTAIGLYIELLFKHIACYRNTSRKINCN